MALSMKSGDICSQCKQFRMMCMCIEDGNLLKVKNGDKTKEHVMQTKGKYRFKGNLKSIRL